MLEYDDKTPQILRYDETISEPDAREIIELYETTKKRLFADFIKELREDYDFRIKVYDALHPKLEVNFDTPVELE